MTEPIDIESLDPLYRDVFRDPANGTPDDISRSGCLALARLGKDAWNAWRDKYPVKHSFFTGYANIANFSACNFEELGITQFSRFSFGDGAKFNLARFSGFSEFVGSIWGKDANFCGARWEESANFLGATWDTGANFQGTQWGYGAIFAHAQWGNRCIFLGAQFGHKVSFRNAKFLGVADFSGCTWEELEGIYSGSMQASLEEAKDWAKARGCSPEIVGVIDFSDANFLDCVDFSNRNFSSKTIFSSENKKTHFCVAPSFYGCVLNQDTTFDGAAFPTATGSDEAIRAYRTLKLAFSQQQAIREEQRFFKLEMAEEAARASGTQGFLYKAYSLCSDYGFSITRPAVLLATTLAVMMLIYGVLSYLNNCLPDPATCRFSTAWIEFSLLQSLPLPGLDKLSDTLRGQIFPTEGLISIGVTVAVIFHKAISLLALFLMGLALRNLFKLK